MPSKNNRTMNIIVLITLFITLTLPSFLITIYSYIQLRDELTSQTISQRKAIATLMAQTIEARLDNVRDIGRSTAADISPYVQVNDWDGAIQQIKYITTEFPYIDRIFLSDPKGKSWAYHPASPENIGADLSYRDWYKGVSKNWQPYVSEIFKRVPIPQLNTVAVVTPIKDSSSNTIGIVGFAMKLDSFYELTTRFSVDKGGFLYIVNQKGQLVAHPKYSAQGPIVDYSKVPVVQKLLQNKSGAEVAYNPIEKEERLAAYVPIPAYNWGVVVADPISTAFSERDKSLNQALIIDTLFILLNIVLAVGIVIVFTRLQKSRETLHQSNERFGFVSKATNDAIYDWDIKTNTVFFGEGMSKLFGYTRDQITETLEWWTNQLHADDKERINTELEEALKSDQNTFKIEYRFKKANGKYAQVTDNAYMERDSDGVAIRYIGVMQDVSDIKQYEDELKRRTDEAERFNKVTLDRELKMMELKKELEEIKAKTSL